MANKLSAEILILSTVLLVALAGAYSSNAGGAVLVIEGDAQTSFERPLGNRMVQIGDRTHYQCQQNAEGEIECCTWTGNEWECMSPQGTFGASQNMREGGEKTYLVSPTRGVLLG